MGLEDRNQKLADAQSVLGQLQRGRGEGFLAACAMPQTEAADLLLACIRHDPRWDSQVEFRSLYYAEIAKEVGLHPSQLGPQPYFCDLAISVLVELGTLGVEAAEKVLLDHVARGDHWKDALEYISFTPTLYKLPDVLQHRFSTSQCENILHEFRQEIPWEKMAADYPWIQHARATSEEKP